MKFGNAVIMAATAAALLSGTAGAATVSGVYNTGLGVGGAVLGAGDGQTDANYKLVSGTVPGVVTGTQAATYYNGAYVSENAGSRWISYSGSPFNGTGNFSVTTTFDLTGYDASTASLTGLWGVDNEGEIFLNGVSTGFSLTGTVVQNFNQLYAFTINSGFVAGLNTLSIRVNDTGAPASVRVDGLSLTANAVPEPASWMLLITGFGLVGVAARRRSVAVSA